MTQNLSDIITEAMKYYRLKWIQQLQDYTDKAPMYAQDVARKPVKQLVSSPRTIARSRIHATKISMAGHCLEQAAYQIARHQEGSHCVRCYPGFMVERLGTTLACCCISTQQTMNAATQARAMADTLTKMRSATVEPCILLLADQGAVGYKLGAHGIHILNAPTAWELLSGDPECWSLVQSALSCTFQDLADQEHNASRALELSIAFVNETFEAQNSSQVALDALGLEPPALKSAGTAPDLMDELLELEQL